MINIEALYGPKFMKLLQICRQKFCEFHLRYFIDQQRLLLIDAKSIFSLHFDRSFLKCSCCCTVHTLNLPATTLFLLSLLHFFVPSWHGHFFILKKVKKNSWLLLIQFWKLCHFIICTTWNATQRTVSSKSSSHYLHWIEIKAHKCQTTNSMIFIWNVLEAS